MMLQIHLVNICIDQGRAMPRPGFREKYIRNRKLEPKRPDSTQKKGLRTFLFIFYQVVSR
jgi:hypothetical protein